MDDNAGRIRTGMVRISGVNFTPPNARLVPEMLDELISYTHQHLDHVDLIWIATVFHHRFVWIHPFIDGNGRTVRLAMNLILMRAGYPPVFILTKDRQKYYTALNAANNGDFHKLLLMMYQAAERSLDIYISSAGGDYDDYLPTQNIAREPDIPYSQEYISLLARRGRIDAYKEGKAWLTTKKAVTDYIRTKRK
jgi:Fic family protein